MEDHQIYECRCDKCKTIGKVTGWVIKGLQKVGSPWLCDDCSKRMYREAVEALGCNGRRSRKREWHEG